MESVTSHIDARGWLNVITPPFRIERAYYISNVPPNALRGNHAHRTCHQYLVCLQGAFSIRSSNHSLKSKLRILVNVGTYIPPLTWLELSDFQPGTIVLVLCSHPYDPADYIKDIASWLETTS